MTTTSRERREHVAQALSLPTYSLTHDECLFLANAALAAALPDRAAFAKAVDRLMVASLLAGADGKTGNETSMERQYLAELRALVFGDDAQAGEE